jgi:hypothetical protein
MKISDLREWAAAEYGAHSHKEGQVLAALGPIEEWLTHLARQGVNFELVPTDIASKLGVVSLKPLHAADEPPTPVDSGGTSTVPDGLIVVPVPTELPDEGPLAEPPVLDTKTFVNDDPNFVAGTPAPPTPRFAPGPAAEVAK